MNPRTRSGRPRSAAFTLVEMMIVVVVVGISAMLVIGEMGNTAGSRLTSAAQLLAADVGYAQAISLTQSAPAVLVLDAANGRYHIASSDSPDTPLTDPVSKQPYISQFGSGRAAAMAGVSISGQSLAGDDVLGFGSLGQLDQSSDATITLSCQGLSLTLTIDAATAEVAIGSLN